MSYEQGNSKSNVTLEGIWKKLWQFKLQGREFGLQTFTGSRMSALPCKQRPFDLPRSREIKGPLLVSEHLATKKYIIILILIERTSL